MSVCGGDGGMVGWRLHAFIDEKAAVVVFAQPGTLSLSLFSSIYLFVSVCSPIPPPFSPPAPGIPMK